MLLHAVESEVMEADVKGNAILIEKEPNQPSNVSDVPKEGLSLVSEVGKPFPYGSSELPMKGLQQCLLDV